MIIRSDDVWTTVQCKNAVGPNEESCDLCFKVLNGRFALVQQCPYCLGKIDLHGCIHKEGPKAAAEKTNRPYTTFGEDSSAAEAS
jgi:hypothetical protein